MGLLEAFGIKTAATNAPKSEVSAPDATRTPQGAASQLIGANAISPMFDPGYALESYLPILLAATPSGNPIKSFTSVARGNGKDYPRGRLSYDKAYAGELTNSFSFTVSYYGQDVEGFNMFMWKGIRMNGLQVVAGFTAERTEEEARALWSNVYTSYGLTAKPVLTLSSGNSGWATLDTGWSLIASPEAKAIWQVTVDSPSYPKNKEPNEAAVLLMVAGPSFDSGRKPLAYFTAPQIVLVSEPRPEKGERARIAALRESVERICAVAGIKPDAIGSVASDCGRDTPAASRRLGEVGAALQGLLPSIDVVSDRIDMVALLGELGANTVNYTLLLAAYAAHARNHPVLYLSNVDPDAARAMLVLPPLDHTPPDPHRTFREHRARGQWYAPWWGQRLDGKKDY